MATDAVITMKDVKFQRSGPKALSLQADKFNATGEISADTGNFRKGLLIQGKSIEEFIQDTIGKMDTKVIQDAIEKMDTHIVCEKGWAGFLCHQDEIDCVKDACNNHGNCTEGKAGTGEYSCACDPGYLGKTCDKKCDTAKPGYYYGLPNCGVKPCNNAKTGEFYTSSGFTNPAGCAVRKCTNAEVGEYYTGAAPVTSSICPVTSCDKASIGYYLVEASGCGAKPCDNGGKSGFFYTSDGGVTNNCKTSSCTNAKAGEKYTGIHRSSNKCPTASCGATPKVRAPYKN